MPIISVIIPIYKVESFIKRCAISLMEQTLQDVEYIFVDDCSPDQSIFKLRDVLKQYPQRCVKIVSHEKNQGLPAARNTGMQCASGKYIFHCDSDDFLEKNALELLVESAEQNNADVVWSDWFLSFEHNERYMKQSNYATAGEALQGVLMGTMKYNVWNKLVRRLLYLDNHIQFPSGHSMGEDMTMIRLMACAQRVSYVPKALYHYVKMNGEAFTNQITEDKLQDVEYNTKETVQFLVQRFGEKFNKEIICFKLNVKYPLLISNNKKMYQKWNDWFSEVNSYIWKNPTSSFRSKVLQMFALKRQFWLLRLYYNCVYRLIYGFIYR